MSEKTRLLGIALNCEFNEATLRQILNPLGKIEAIVTKIDRAGNTRVMLQTDFSDAVLHEALKPVGGILRIEEILHGTKVIPNSETDYSAAPVAAVNWIHRPIVRNS